jgi:Family of unknown function (DUF6353)
MQLSIGLIKDILKTVGMFAVDNAPTILTTLAIGSGVSTVVSTIPATVKAVRIVDEEATRRMDKWTKDTGEDQSSYPLDPILTPFEVIKLTWKEYLPTLGLGIITTGCIISANDINLRRNAALAGLYKLAQTSLNEYQEKVRENFGERKEARLRDELHQDKLEKNPVEKSQVILAAPGETLFYDSLSGRYFESDLETVRRVINDYNRDVINTPYKTLNEFYKELGLEGVAMGRRTGWSTEHGLLQIEFTTRIATNGKPCIVLDYKLEPSRL